MATIFEILEDGKTVDSMAQLLNVYYLLENDDLFRSQTAIGFCEDCADYRWIEDLTVNEVDEEDEVSKKIFKDFPEMKEQQMRLAEFLKIRSTPPRCLCCSGLRVVQLDLWPEESINPANGKKYSIKMVETGCFLHIKPVFLNPDGILLKLPEERAKQLAEKLKFR